MAWRKRATRFSMDVDVKVDVDDIETETLLQSLIDRGLLRESEAEAIAARRRNDFATGLFADDFGEALDEIRRGRRDEALIHLERALGGDFVGRLAPAS